MTDPHTVLCMRSGITECTCDPEIMEGYRELEALKLNAARYRYLKDSGYINVRFEEFIDMEIAYAL